MFELHRYLNDQLDLTRIYFDKKDAERALEDAQGADDYEEPQLREITMEQFVQEGREAGLDDFGIYELLIHEADGFDETVRKAALYDKMIEDRRKGARAVNSISAEERKARAKKAAKARWSK